MTDPTRGVCLGAVRAVARAEVRAGGRGLTLIAVLFGLVSGVVLGAVGLAERTSTAYPRLVEQVHLDDARVLVAADQPQLAAAVPTLPGVERARTDQAWVAQLDGPALRFISIGAPTTDPGDLVRPVIVAGRRPARDAPDELLISEPLAQSSGLAVGSQVSLSMLTLREVSMFDVGFGMPDGPTAVMKVVGIGRMPDWGGALASAQGSPAFAAKYRSDLVAYAIFVRLHDDPAAAQRFGAAYARTAAVVDQLSPSILGQTMTHEVELPTATVDPSVRAAEHVLVVGLIIFVVVLALGGLQVVGQGLLRHHGARRTPQRVEAALGMRPAERTAARVLAASWAAVLAAVLAAGLAFAAGWLEPLGSQARFEPSPGFRPHWSVIVLGAISVAVMFLVLVAGATALVGARPAAALRPVRPADTRLLRRWPAVLLGTRLALRGRRVRRGLPPATTVVAASLAIAGVVAAVAFGASLQRLVDTPSRYGQAADLTLADAREPDVARLVEDPRVAALDVGYAGTGTLVDGTDVDVTAREHRKGVMPSAVTQGRPPAAPGEVAIGPRLGSEVGRGIGDTIELRGADDDEVTLRVTGIAVTVSQNGVLGDDLLVVPEQLPVLVAGEPTLDAAILAAPGATDELFAELSQDLEIFERTTPDGVRNLADLVMLPELLAIVLAVIAGAGMVHALLTAGRRHAREVAVLSVLGATPAQVRTTMAVMAAATVLPALLIGVPLGLGAARVLWWQLATATGLSGDLAVPTRLLLVLVPAVLVGALLLSLAPALRASRTPPAVALDAR